MILKISPRKIVIFCFILAISSAAFAFAATNTVPTTRLTNQTKTVNANALKPAACASLNLTAIIICPAAGGYCSGTDASELILGSPLIDDIQGGKGDDCILGGGGDDSIRGEQDNDVCIGGPGNDSFHNTCETQIQ